MLWLNAMTRVLEFSGEMALGQPISHFLCKAHRQWADFCYWESRRQSWEPLSSEFEPTALWHFKAQSHMVHSPEGFHCPCFFFLPMYLARPSAWTSTSLCIPQHSPACLLCVCPTALPHIKPFLILRRNLLLPLHPHTPSYSNKNVCFLVSSLGTQTCLHCSSIPRT